jgi:signal peptidase I
VGNTDQLTRHGRGTTTAARVTATSAGPVLSSHGNRAPGKTAPGKPAPGKTWQRTVLYGAGTISMLIISMASSLSLWIALPWGFLGWSPTLVTSGSMEPLVSPGDVVMIRPVTPEELLPNTVVLYDRPDTGRVLHRILEQMPDGTFRTGGDANAVPDSALVHLEDVEGAAVLAVPWVGRPALWFAQQRWLLLGGSPGTPGDRQQSAGRRLLPAELHTTVLERLDAQTAAAQRRTTTLLEGLS